MKMDILRTHTASSQLKQNNQLPHTMGTTTQQTMNKQNYPTLQTDSVRWCWGGGFNIQ